MHVQAVCKCNGRAFTDIVVDIFFVSFGLQFIRHGEHDDIGPSGCFCNAHSFQAFAFRFCNRSRPFTQRNHEVFRTAVAQVQRMGMALAAIAENGDFFVFDQIYIAIAIIINAHSGVLS